MSKFKITTAIAAIVLASSAPFAMAQTTLGGNAKDNSATGGRENGNASDSGKSVTGRSTSTPTTSSAGAGTGESKTTATGGQPGGRADRN